MKSSNIQCADTISERKRERERKAEENVVEQQQQQQRDGQRGVPSTEANGDEPRENIRRRRRRRQRWRQRWRRRQQRERKFIGQSEFVVIHQRGSGAEECGQRAAIHLRRSGRIEVRIASAPPPAQRLQLDSRSQIARPVFRLFRKQARHHQMRLHPHQPVNHPGTARSARIGSGSLGIRKS